MWYSPLRAAMTMKPAGSTGGLHAVIHQLRYTRAAMRKNHSSSASAVLKAWAALITSSAILPVIGA